MSKFDNPTALTVGKSGKLCGLNYRVIGRVVLGVDVDGETYYWNEFNLLDDSGQSATLVFEETEEGPEWKLFIMFDPVEPMTAAEAAHKKVGDTVALNGKPIKVTLVGQSRVYHIEGQAPEGVEVGDIANYFNADTGVEMEVASWTGNEIEFFRGIDVSVDDVASGFNLPVEKLTGGGLALADTETEAKPSVIPKLIPVIIIGVVALIAFTSYFKTERRRLSAAPRKQQTPPSRFPGCSVIEIARTGSRYDWHEYPRGDGALLINGLTGDFSQWHLFRPAQPAAPLTPVAAAALRAGNLLILDSVSLTVRDLFQAPTTGKFGLLAQSDKEWAVVRWTADNVEYYLGRALTEKEVLAAFK
jgi:hypothetical protein